MLFNIVDYQQVGLVMCKALIDFNAREIQELKDKVKKECNFNLFNLYFKQALDEILEHKIIEIKNNQIILDSYSNYSNLVSCLIFKKFEFY